MTDPEEGLEEAYKWIAEFQRLPEEVRTEFHSEIYDIIERITRRCRRMTEMLEELLAKHSGDLK